MKRICLNRSVLNFMDARIDRRSYVVEYGAGWSTRWFAERCGKLLSIETDMGWIERVKPDLQGVCCDWRIEESKSPGGVKIGQPDMVLIDCAEQHRLACAKSGWNALKPGGWLIFDDAQRQRHAEAIRGIPGTPKRLVWSGGDIETAKERLALAWRKP